MTKTYKCILIDDEPTAREILEMHLKKIETIEIVASCKNALEAIKILNKEIIDLAFLDINMPEIDGLSLAKIMPKEVKIIFTTAYREYAIDGFDLQAVDYLLKPISLERLLQGIQKFIGETSIAIDKEIPTETSPAHDFIFVRADRKMLKINFDEINYIESLQDYLKIHLDTKIVVTRETLSNIEVRLPKYDFIRIHRSFIVALKSINSFTNEQIVIKKQSIPISRNYRKSVIAFLSNI